MKHRRDIINYFVSKNKARKYLELGLHNPDEVFNHINCEIKHSVDINDKFSDYNMSCDNFFDYLNKGILDLEKNYKWDIIFIDANHLVDFVKNDVLNSLEHLNDGGFIFIHDVLPHSYDTQTEFGGNQTAWKFVPFFLKNYPEYHICTVEEMGGGLGIIFRNDLGKRKLLDQNFNIFYEYYIMNNDRSTSQNIKSFDELEDWIQNPTYDFKKQEIENKTNMFKEHFQNII